MKRAANLRTFETQFSEIVSGPKFTMGRRTCGFFSKPRPLNFFAEISVEKDAQIFGLTAHLRTTGVYFDEPNLSMKFEVKWTYKPVMKRR